MMPASMPEAVGNCPEASCQMGFSTFSLSLLDKIKLLWRILKGLEFVYWCYRGKAASV